MQTAKKLRGIFLNPEKANCSIYESGLMMHKCLVLSDKYELDYREIGENDRFIPGDYDFYAFNYHHITMGWLDTRSLSELPGLKFTFVLEVSPNDPFVLCPEGDFDAYCVLDPSMDIDNKRVYAFPRPLELPPKSRPNPEQGLPVIGSFGFATPGKGFELVVDAVNREFDRAVIRINMPEGTYADEACWALHKQDYAQYLNNLCSRTAKQGVEVIVTRDFMSKSELIEWCSQNTLNCFLYNRIQPGLAATTDQAISSGRPLAVSDNETFRHITKYVKPYPCRTLKESVSLSQPEVRQMQAEWSPLRFARKFEGVLSDFEIAGSKEIAQGPGNDIELKKKPRPNRVVRKLGKIARKIHYSIKPSNSATGELSHIQRRLTLETGEHHEKILIVSHKEKQCGIHQYAINIRDALIKSSNYIFEYAECSNPQDLDAVIAGNNPGAIIYNYYPYTMPWLTSDITRQYSIPQLGVMHEVTQQLADDATDELFDFHLCPDPTLVENNPIIYKTKRLIPPYINTKYSPEVTTIGSFGFGFCNKGFETTIEVVQREFEHARILLHLPFNDIVDKDGRQHTLETARRCRHLVKKPGIHLQINHDFLSKQKLLDLLAANTVNVFFYETNRERGISSTIEHALAVQRPMAVTKCGMFRHILAAKPSICIEDTCLTEIIDNGIEPLVPFYNEWSEAAFIHDYDQIFKRVFHRWKTMHVSR